ncbi:MAG: hypothetical protein ACOYD4_06930 [Solirubrobacterales bacterium]
MENTYLERAVLPVIQTVAGDLSTGIAIRGNNLEMWRSVNQSAIEWANQFYRSGNTVGGLPHLNETARNAVADMMNAWRNGTLDIDTSAQGLPRLVRALEPAFGRARAQVIAETETSRTFNEGVMISGNADEFVTGYTLIGAADERTCDVCAPVEGQYVEKGSAGFVHPVLGLIGWPPFHPKCRHLLQMATRRVRRGSAN